MSCVSRSQASSSRPTLDIFHTAASRRLQKAAATSSSSPSPSPSATSSILDVAHRSQQQPSGDYTVLGVSFKVDFDRVTLNERRLVGDRLGYRVRHKSMIQGGRPPSTVWRYGSELEYEDDNGAKLKLFLCKLCHES